MMKEVQLAKLRCCTKYRKELVYSTCFMEGTSNDFWGRGLHHGDGENALGMLHGEIKDTHMPRHVLITSDSMLRGMAHPKAPNVSTYQTPLVRGYPTSTTYRSRPRDIVLNRKYTTTIWVNPGITARHLHHRIQDHRSGCKGCPRFY